MAPLFIGTFYIDLVFLHKGKLLHCWGGYFLDTPDIHHHECTRHALRQTGRVRYYQAELGLHYGLHIPPVFRRQMPVLHMRNFLLPEPLEGGTCHHADSSVVVRFY